MVGDKKLKIAVLFENNFPIADAGANRLLSLAKGICEMDNELTVYCIRPSEREPDIVNKEICGTYETVNYVYPANTTVWPVGKIGRIKSYLKGLINTWRAIHNSSKKQKVDVIISYSFSLWINFVFWLYSKLYKVRFVFLVDEFPYSILEPNKHNFLFKYLELNVLYKCFDIILVMTSPLKEFYSKIMRKNAIIEIIPMTVEPERFENYVGPRPQEYPYFAYAGFLGNNKDGIDILIKAFSKVVKEYENIYLYIIGYSNNIEDHIFFKRLAQDIKIDDKIVFTGKVHRDDIPKYLCNATGLVLARPDNVQAKGGFPTKLGEYLATGNPVVVTRVGEIPLYLKDNFNAFVAEPNSVDSFSDKMLLLLNNREKANLIGQNGKILTQEVFNYKYQAKNILKYIK